jgi:SP family galactose:H+ symporter-like MFS transporter
MSAFGCLSSGFFADFLGRKRAIFVAACFFLVGVLLCATSNSFSTLIIGRMILGVGLGLGEVTSPLLLSEIAPSKIRGTIVAYIEVMNNVGIFLGFLIGYLFTLTNSNDSWRYSIGLGIIPSIMLMILLKYIPESPRWLILKNRKEEA